MIHKKIVKNKIILAALFVAFDKYISLFLLPLVMFLYAVFFIHGSYSDTTRGIIAGIWIFLAVITAIVAGLFFLCNIYLLKWRLNWWKNLLLSILFVMVGSFIFGLIIRSAT